MDQFKYQCFSTVTFKNNGFDDEIEASAELHKFGGGQHFIKPKELDHLLGKISNEELDLLENLVKAVSKLDRTYREKYHSNTREEISSILCLPSMMRSILSIRILLEIGKKEEYILDIGPGSGYFGLMAAHLGYKIISTDISSGYFCFQSYLYSNILGENQYELFDGITNKKRRDSNRVIHIPVWEWSRESFELPENASLMFANHMLNEMHRHSLLYLMELLEKNKSQHFVSIEGWGYGSRTNPKLLAQTQKIFKLYGYSHYSHQEMPGFHAIDILKKTGTRRIEYIENDVYDINRKGKESEMAERISAVYNKDTADYQTTQNRWSSCEEGMLPSEAFTHLKQIYEKECLYKRCDQEFIDSIGTASDSNRLFLKGMKPGEYI